MPDTPAECSKYVCIECGHPAESLFRIYPGGSIRLTRCTLCNNVTDKYVEQEGVLLSLDLALHRLPAFRHLIFNHAVTSCLSILAQLQLTLVLLALDVFLMRHCELVSVFSTVTTNSNDDMVLVARLVLSSFADHVAFVGTIVFLSRALRTPSEPASPPLSRIYCGIILPQLFKLTAAFVLIWDKTIEVVSTVRCIVATMQAVALTSLFGWQRAWQCLAGGLLARMIVRFLLAALGLRVLIPK